jgi:hypothetical protein
MAEIKTKPTEQTVENFLKEKVTDERIRKDCDTLIKMMKKVTGSAPKMWGPSIIGFGKYHYKYESGHEGDMCITGFSPRKPDLSIYVLAGQPNQDELLKKLGKHKAGKACLYVRRLEDVDLKILEKLIVSSIDYTRKKYPSK